MKQVAKITIEKYIAPLEEMAKDGGLIGQILRTNPDYEWMLPVADKRAEQNTADQKKKQDPNRLPTPDPWQILLDAPAVSDKDKKVFRAAQSQLPALRHLIHIVEGIATLNTDWHQESIKARAQGHMRKHKHANRKVTDAHVLNQRVQEHISRQNNPELLKQMERLLKRRRAQFVHRGKKNELERQKRWPSWNEFSKHHRLEVALVEWWVRCGVNSVPGLMFWRNEAITDFLRLRFGLSSTALPPSEVKKIRQRLGLISASKNNHFVWRIYCKNDPEGNRKIYGYKRNNGPAFSAEIVSGK